MHAVTFYSYLQLSNYCYFSGLPSARPAFLHHNNHMNQSSGSQLSKVKEDIVTVTKTMQKNMSKVLDRGSKLDDLQDKTGNI